MKEWRLIRSDFGNSCLSLDYGDLRAVVGVITKPGMFNMYDAHWKVTSEFDFERGYSGIASIDPYELYKCHVKVTDQSIRSLMGPVLDMARVAMFICVVEKLI